MILFRLLSWPYARRHILRTALTVAAIVLGTGVYVGMRTANETVLYAFSQTVDRIAGKAELQVTAGDAGFGEEILDQVQGASTVRIAVPVIEAVVDSGISSEGKLLVLAVDMTGDQGLRDYDFDDRDGTIVQDALIFLAQPDSIILSKEFADRNGIRSGNRMRLQTANGERPFTVRGLMKSTGLATAFGGSIAVMDIYAAQKMFGRGRTFDRIELAPKKGVTLAECRRELEELLGPAFEVQAPSSRSQQFETILGGYSVVVSISSAFALLIAIFIIYNTFALAVTQRRHDIGILRAIGATRPQIHRLFLGESVILGAVGSILGLGAGVLVSGEIAKVVGQLVADVYGVAQRANEIAAQPRMLAVAFATGVLSSVIAAVIPARQAARVEPVEALQRGAHDMVSRSEGRGRLLLGGTLAGSAAILLVPHDVPFTLYLGCALTLVCVLVMCPLLSVWVTRAMRPVLRRIRPIEGTLAADSLMQSPRRTSVTVGALIFSLALIVAFAGLGRATYESLSEWMNTTLNPDLFVMPSPRMDVQTTRFPADMGPEIAGLAGVSRVQTLRNARVNFRSTPVMVVAVEMTNIAETDPREPIEGNRATMYLKAAQGAGVLVSDNLARFHRLTLGEMVEIPAPYGVLRLPIVGVVLDYSDQQGAVIVDRAVYTKFWHDDTVNVYRVYAQRGVDVSGLRQSIIDRFSGRQVFVLTNQSVKAYVLSVIRQWLGLTTIQIALGVLVAILGIVNTLTVSISDRRRELAVLQAVGGLRGQIRRTIWMEAVGIGVIGLVLGCAVGSVLLYYGVRIAQQDAGMRLAYRFPIDTVLLLIPIIVGSAFVAALWPAESAVRGSLVEGLEYE